MHAYVVTGLILIYLFSRRTEAYVSMEIEATNADAARDRVLAMHQATAQLQDPYATVVWEERPNVRRATALAWAA